MKHIVKHTLALVICALALLALVACAPSELSYEEQKAAYDGIIEQYTTLLKAKQNGETLTPPDTTGMSEGEAAVAEAVYAAVNITNFPEDMAYTYWDMDGNGTLELLLLTSPPTLKAIFTLDGKTPVVLGHADEDVMWYYSTQGELIRIYEAIEGEQGNNTVTYARVAGAALTEDTSFGVTYEIKDGKRTIIGYYEMADGGKQTIDKERYDSLSEASNALWDPANLYKDKLNTPCMFFPLVEGAETPPLADFSTYEAVKSTFKAMVAYVPRANAQWHTGKLDTCFSFANDTDFETYNYLLYLAYRYSPDKGTFVSNYPENGEQAYGYCETDLNGDGSDELLLMTDDYMIFSIFTTVKGKVVPVEGYADFAMDWDPTGMDGEGRFYGINIPTDGLGRERAIFEITPDGKLTKTLHLYEIWMSEDDGYFKFENGEKIRLTEEEYKTLMKEYDKLDTARYGNGGETVHNCTKITFTPLFERATADHIPADYPWTNGYYGSLRLYLSQVSDESVTFTFEWIEYNEEGYKENSRQLSDVMATLTDGKYVFDRDGVKGYLEFGVYKIWFVVESSEDDSIVPRAYRFDFYDNIMN